MKQSYYTAPRSLDEATFLSWGEAIEPMPQRHSSFALLIYAAALVLTCAAAVFIVA